MKLNIVKNFKLNLMIRILLITMILAIFVFCIFILENYIKSTFALFVIIFLISELIWYIEKTNRNFENFLTAILNDDFTTYYSTAKENSSSKLIYNLFNQITSKFKKIRNERELKHTYLLNLIEQINIGIISFDENGGVHLINQTFMSILKTFKVSNIHQLNKDFPDFLQEIKLITPDKVRLFKFIRDGELMQLSITASEFKLVDTYYKLISIQNIKNELDEKEIETWHKLIRVLTHEIMNSVTPVTSLSSTLFDIIKNTPDKSDFDEKKLKYLENGLEAITVRSKGLLKFTQTFQNLTRIPQPNFTTIDSNDFFKRIQFLFENKLNELSIKFTVQISKNSTQFIADMQLMEQVIINLIKNSVEAIQNTDNRFIKLEMDKTDDDKTFISIIDNGKGIQPDELDKVFIPFYTTKETGSGIGLSISKQILRLHNGTISVHSEPEKLTVFTLKF